MLSPTSNQQVTEVTRWCKDNYRCEFEDREKVTDLRKKEDVSEPCIEGVTVEIVNKYKYLGTVWDNKLTFEHNANKIVKIVIRKCSACSDWDLFVGPKTLHILL